MRVLILGSGLLGLTTAYVLAKRGHQVTVIDRQSESSRECSFANGGQLSYSHGEPWPTPGVLPKLPKWLINPDSPLFIRPRLDPAMIGWGLSFLRNCTTRRAEHSTAVLLRLGMYSKEKLAEIREDTKIEFDFGQRGILYVFTKQKDFEGAQRQAEFQAKFGCREIVLSAEECLKLEPSLAHTERTILGGLHDVSDETGNAYLFGKKLAEYCETKLGVAFHFNTTIERIESAGTNVAAVITDKGRLNADAYVMALGAYSSRMLRQLGIRIPVYPMKGYSLTIPMSSYAPQLSVSDNEYKVVYTPLGDVLRVAGTAELCGYDHSIREQRIAPILRNARKLFPKIDWETDITTWSCLRPSTPDGPPLLGATPISNLFLNTGHGTLGWTQAAGSAYLVADIMERKPPEIITSGLTMERL